MATQGTDWLLEQFHFFMAVFDQGGLSPVWKLCQKNPAYHRYLQLADRTDFLPLMRLSRQELFTRLNNSLTAVVNALSVAFPDRATKFNGLEAFILLNELLKQEAAETSVDRTDPLHMILPLVLQELTLTMRMQTISLACEVHFGCTLPELTARAEQGDEEASLHLVTLEPGILSSPPIAKLVEYHSLVGDRDFFTRLSKAIRPDPNFWNMKDQRNRYALSLLAGFGYQAKPYHEWAGFFGAYNEKYCPDPETLAQRGFPTYEDASTLAKACKRYQITKIHARKRQVLDT